ncbi:MAG: hypothetical protein EA360_07580 [Balneolaceae bacterium]|nr:MAG: hypothetical protein EA360_07580 [Balneolaceae bacterium]
MPFRIIISALLVLFLWSCAGDREDPDYTTIIQGVITVDSQLDRSGDFSGIQILSTIVNRDGITDTLFVAVTDTSGSFSGTARFSESDFYPLIISRNQNVFGILNVIFSKNDTLSVQAVLPNVSGTVEISSREHDVLEIYERVDRGFNRVVNFINAGAISSADSIQAEIEKWSDIYWELYEEYPGSYAGRVAGEMAVSILRDWNDAQMLERAEEFRNRSGSLSNETRGVLIEYVAESEGLDAALDYLIMLRNESTGELNRIEIDVQMIELLYDSSRIVEADQLLNRFTNEFGDNPVAMDWAENTRFDLEFLAPGNPFPPISFRVINGDYVTTSDLTGNPLLIEITRLDNLLYQQQYDRTVAIYQLYKNFGLEVVTIPLAANELMINAFFSERNMQWKIAEPGSFDPETILNALNLTRVPTRFLIDRDGNIVRRYIGNEYDDIVRGLQQITNQ